MSIFLEHLIRSSLFESLEDYSPWRYQVVGSESLIGQYVNKQSKKFGAKRGVLLKAKKIMTTAPTDPDIVIDGFIDYLETRKVDYNDAPLRDFYNDGKHTYVFFQIPKSNKKKMMFVLLIYENETYKTLIDVISKAETMSQYFIISPNPRIKDMVNSSIKVMNATDYRDWKNAIDTSIQDLKNQAEKSKEREALAIVKHIESIYNNLEKQNKFIDFQKLANRLSLSKVDVPEQPEAEKEEIVKIDDDSTEYKNLPSSFKGDAKKKISATGQIKLVPVKGTIDVVYVQLKSDYEIQSGQFKGEFNTQGLPEQGTVKYLDQAYDRYSNGPDFFNGVLNTNVDITSELNNPSFIFGYKKGVMRFWNGVEYAGSYVPSDNADIIFEDGELRIRLNDVSIEKIKDSKYGNSANLLKFLPEYEKYKLIYKELGDGLKFEGTFKKDVYNNLGAGTLQFTYPSYLKIGDISQGGKKGRKGVNIIYDENFYKERNEKYDAFNKIISNPWNKSVTDITYVRIEESSDGIKQKEDTISKSNIKNLRLVNTNIKKIDNIDYYLVLFSIKIGNKWYPIQSDRKRRSGIDQYFYIKSTDLNSEFIQYFIDNPRDRSKK